jgi:hypothetical protein
MTTLANSADLPQSMLIDYVRVYKKATEKATPILTTDGIAQICIDTLNPAPAEKIVWAPYYPEVIYQWSSPSFEIFPVISTITRPPQRMQIRTKPGIIPNQFHPVYLTSTFPGGHEEYDTLMIYLPTAPPPPPQANFISVQIDTLCYFEFRKPLSPVIIMAEYNNDDSAGWQTAKIRQTMEGAFFCFDTVRPETSRTFLWREWNSCGVSPEIQAVITTPPPEAGCKWPAGINGSDQQGGAGANRILSLSPCPVTDKLTINLGPAPAGKGHESILSLYDPTGKLVGTKYLEEGNNTLELSFMKPGLFFIRITCGTETLFSGKWIRQ